MKTNPRADVTTMRLSILAVTSAVSAAAWWIWQQRKQNRKPQSAQRYETGSWFTEKHDHGLGVCLRIDRMHHRETTEFQEFVLFESNKFGRTLVIDGVVQITEKDAPFYHEMYVHTAFLARPREVGRVLVLGGGDGYMVNEALKHPNAAVDWVDIDDRVRQVCIDYFFSPERAAMLRGPRVNLLTMDAADHVSDKSNWGAYDVVISDMQIPTDATRRVYTEETHRYMVRCLRPGGVIVLQGSNFFIDAEEEGDITRSMLEWIQSMVDQVEVCTVPVVGYVGGSTGILFGSVKDVDGSVTTVKGPVRGPDGLEDLKVYTPEYHRAAFELPRNLTTMLAALDPSNRRRKILPGEQLTADPGDYEAIRGDGGADIYWAKQKSVGFTVAYTVRQVEGKGVGLVAEEAVNAGATVCEFTTPGCVKSFTESELKKKLEKVRAVHGRSGCSDFLGRMFCLSECPLVSFHHPGDAQYWNHDKNPNTIMLSDSSGPLRSIALRDISPGEEITEFYTRYTNSDWYVSLCRAEGVDLFQDGNWGR